MSVRLTSRRIPIALALAAVAASLCVGWRIWATPVRYQVVGGAADGAGTNPRFEERRFTDVSALGWLPLAVPGALAAAGAWAAARGSRRGLVACAAALGLFALIAGFSIGAAYWPAFGLLALAGVAAFLVGPMPPATGSPSHPSPAAGGETSR
jgi:hypothetical protein